MTVSTHIPEPDSSIRGADQFTEDQLHFLRVSRQKAVHDALTRYVRGATVAFLLVFAALGYNQYQRDRDLDVRRADAVSARQQIVRSGNAVAVAGCNRDYRTITRLRNVLTASHAFQRSALKRGDISSSQFTRASEFYRSQLDGLPLPDCRIAAHTVTDNPDRHIKVPTPLHDG